MEQLDVVRAGVFIGVDRSGDLQPLNDAVAGARRMYAWALAQGMTDGRQAKLITDADGKKVDPELIYDAITDIIDGPGVDQLIVYFAGHGVNINRGEHWLLSDAPRRTGAAVNVSGSVELARYCGIGNVVIISDACRVAPEGIQAQGVRGQDVFPNDGAGDRARPVDQFFACALGRTAAEIKDPAAAAAGFQAVYTGALLDALNGLRPEVFDDPEGPDDGTRYIRSCLLEWYLEQEVPARIRALGLRRSLGQLPDALLMAHHYWLARIASVRPPATRPVIPPLRTSRVRDLHNISSQLVHSAVTDDEAGLRREIWKAEHSLAPDADRLANRLRHTATPFGRDHFETGCGIKIRGARLTDYYAPRLGCEPLGSDGALVRVHMAQERAASVLLQFDGGAGAVLPVFADFLSTVTFEGAELVDVSFEPSAASARWGAFNEQEDRIRAVRAAVATALQYSRLDPGRDLVRAVDQARYDHTVDPTVALCAAYAYHDGQQYTGRIRRLDRDQRADLGVTLFDIALVGRDLVGRRIDASVGIVPFVPLLSRGWSLLSAHRVTTPPGLDGLDATMHDSPWSLYDPHGVDQIRSVLASGDVR